MVWVRFHIMDDPVYSKLKVISLATGTSVKWYSPKSFSSFKPFLELFFIRIMHTYALKRLFETSVQPNTCDFFLALLIRRICRLLSTCGIWLVGVLLVICVLQLQKRTLAEHTNNMEFSSPSRHSKFVWLHATSYSSTYCNVWWLHQILI